jgi:broad specificity phosphatase PhoE
MAVLFLVRHGQASFGTADYDRLSDLGRQQSRWLGEYFAARGIRFKRAVAGSLQRQQHTAQEILAGMNVPPATTPAIESHDGLNEYNGEALYAAHTQGRDPVAHQQSDYREYWRTLKAAMHAWAVDDLAGAPETWSEFGTRTRTALAFACAGAGRDDAVLAVSSGGAISRAVVDIIGSPGATAVEFNLQFRNTGVCELIAGSGSMRLVTFNTLPHLERPDRQAAITHA